MVLGSYACWSLVLLLLYFGSVFFLEGRGSCHGNGWCLVGMEREVCQGAECRVPSVECNGKLIAIVK